MLHLLNHLQGWVLHHFLGPPDPMPDHPLHEDILPNIKYLKKRGQIEWHLKWKFRFLMMQHKFKYCSAEENDVAVEQFPVMLLLSSSAWTSVQSSADCGRGVSFIIFSMNTSIFWPLKLVQHANILPTHISSKEIAISNVSLIDMKM